MIISLKINILFINNFGEFFSPLEIQFTIKKKLPNPNRPTRGPATQTLTRALPAGSSQPPPSPSQLPPPALCPSPLP
jgi:hypothetical protein